MISPFMESRFDDDIGKKISQKKGSPDVAKRAGFWEKNFPNWPMVSWNEGKINNLHRLNSQKSSHNNVKEVRSSLVLGKKIPKKKAIPT